MNDSSPLMVQVSHPLCDRSLITTRIDAVSEIVESMGFIKGYGASESDGESSGIIVIQPEVHHILSSVLTSLGRSPDIQLGITRIFHCTATASEVEQIWFLSIVTAIFVNKHLYLHISLHSLYLCVIYISLANDPFA